MPKSLLPKYIFQKEFRLCFGEKKKSLIQTIVEKSTLSVTKAFYVIIHLDDFKDIEN